MADVTTSDVNLGHLYPPFAEKVKLALAQVIHETKGKLEHVGIYGWKITETFRSQARQNWLYGSGRTRPGSIVTYKQGATGNHPKGLAVDIWPVDKNGNVLWDADGACWQWLGHAVRTQGMQSGSDYTGSFKDPPHMEPPKALALLWSIPAILYLKKLGLR